VPNPAADGATAHAGGGHYRDDGHRCGRARAAIAEATPGQSRVAGAWLTFAYPRRSCVI
jgi:hypothetical protein